MLFKPYTYRLGLPRYLRVCLQTCWANNVACLDIQRSARTLILPQKLHGLLPAKLHHEHNIGA